MRLLRIKEVSEVTGLPVSSIYAAMGVNSFPRPVKIGSRAVGWKSRDIIAWLESRPLANASQRADA